MLVVSNRLPVTLVRSGRGIETRLSAGGLATGIGTLHARGDGLWIGWPGDCEGLTDADAAEVATELEGRRLIPVHLSGADVEAYYEGIANGVLWPLFHYLPEQLPLKIDDWDAYERVNAQFAEEVLRVHRPGDVVWVHDYHLMLVPEMLRGRIPDARIGFFLHIPFPAYETFRTLPFRERVLEGLLGADLVGFHTAAYARSFGACLLHLLGLSTRVDRVQVADREVRIGAFPMGIDAAAWAARADDPDLKSEVLALRGGEDGSALLVGIDRLDYTKGIPRRLLAFERLLELHPELHGRVRLVQVAVPSRTAVEAYREFRRGIEGQVGRINGRFGTPSWVPVNYLRRSLAPRDVAALYRAADVMIVTPVRDGMNLVAKEFVACRSDEDGVLVLSEFTGAASELAEALHVNPYDVERTAQAIHRALVLAPGERRIRMRALRRRVLSHDVGRWADDFLSTLSEAAEVSHPVSAALTRESEIAALTERLRAAPSLVLLLDYDGTLVPFAGVPELAAPDADLLALLERLARRPGTHLHVVSGRPRATLDGWLGNLPIWLHGEHGFWSRRPGEDWESVPMQPAHWYERARGILEDFRARTPGSLVEEKSAALTWHYRMADPEFGTRQANELRAHLADALSNEPVEILLGEKVIELRAHGITKGRVVDPAVRAAPAGSRVLAMGDDRTDEDLFEALPADGIAVHVGAAPSCAKVRIRDWHAARALLAAL